MIIKIVETNPSLQSLESQILRKRNLNTRKRTKLVKEGEYIAEVEVLLIYDESGWSPYLSLNDAYKLDDVREALRKGDIESASRLAKVYQVKPVAV